MNKQFKKEWIEALKSNKYKQTDGVLRSSEGYCCLGVLCDVIDSSKWVEQKVCDECYDLKKECTCENLFEDEYDTVYGYEDISQRELLDEDLLKLTELTDGQQNELTRMNDRGDSFEVIANYIQENL